MKVNKDQYEKALKNIERLRKAEGRVKLWDEAKKLHPSLFEHDVIEVEQSANGLITIKVQRKEVPRVSRETTAKTA